MKVFLKFPTTKLRVPCVLTIGNFDGVHLGHQILLKKVREAATYLSLNATAIIFEPHPRDFLASSNTNSSTIKMATPRITSLRDKLHMFSQANLDRVIIKRFNNTFAALSPKDFIEKILVHSLNMHLLIVGEDFCFGANRAGNLTTLICASQTYGFKIDTVKNINFNGRRISSSALRTALTNADFQYANQLLGRSYTISGHVTHGQKLGRKIGFPTINIRIKQKNPVLSGIFIVQVHGLEPYPLPAVANLGIRPILSNNTDFLLEVYILNYNSECYGKILCVEFLKKIRDEEKYIDMTMLTIAITRDAEQAQAWFNTKIKKS